MKTPGRVHDRRARALDGLGPGKFLPAGVSRGAWLALTLASGRVAIQPIGRSFLWSVREVATCFDPRAALRPLLFGGLKYRAHHPRSPMTCCAR